MAILYGLLLFFFSLFTLYTLLLFPASGDPFVGDCKVDKVDRVCPFAVVMRVLSVGLDKQRSLWYTCNRYRKAVPL